jgi:integrase
MTKVKLRYLHAFIDRHGKRRLYFRKDGARIPLPSDTESPEFAEAYRKALGGPLPKAPAALPPISSGRTFDALALEYFRSPAFLDLEPGTQYNYRKAIERLIKGDEPKHRLGHRLVSGMESLHVSRLLGRYADRPGAGNDALKKLRVLLRFAISIGWRKDDPTIFVKKFKDGEGFHTWDESEVAQFEARWPVGSMPRTAFDLLIYSAQRSSDVARMVWGDVAGGRVRAVQSKTGTKVSIPQHPRLKESLDATPKTDVVIIISALGRPFSTKGFGNWMADRIADAGLPERCVTHGLRKAAARRLAEAGATTLEIAAITGHKSLREIERYTRAAAQETLADSAMKRLREQDENP